MQEGSPPRTTGSPKQDMHTNGTPTVPRLLKAYPSNSFLSRYSDSGVLGQTTDIESNGRASTARPDDKRPRGVSPGVLAIAYSGRKTGSPLTTIAAAPPPVGSLFDSAQRNSGAACALQRSPAQTSRTRAALSSPTSYVRRRTVS